MKTLILFSIAFSFVTAAYAQDRIAIGTNDGGESASYKRKQKIDAIEFFSPLIHPDPHHPDNNRNQHWPEKLTLEPVGSMSKKEFKERLIGNWRMVYHCDGEPIVLHKDLFDEKNSTTLEIVYEDTNFITYEFRKSELKHKEIKMSSKYSIEQGSENFIINYDKFPSDAVHFIRIKETGQVGLYVQPLTFSGITCSNGSKSRPLLLRSESI